MQSKASWLHLFVYFSVHQDDMSYGLEAVQIEYPESIFECDLVNDGK